MKKNDTIAAISTPPGTGGIAVIRISGPNAVVIVSRIFDRPADLKRSKTHCVHHGWVVDKSENIDEVLVSVFRAPKSYTGENVVEISCHGGVFISRKILELVVENGARPANPGEFTQRAFLNGRMDLTQAEAVADLIQAKTDISRRIAVTLLEGKLSKKLLEIRNQLIEACSLLEVELDFSEEDAVFVSRKELKESLKHMRIELKGLIETFERGRYCRDGIRTTIVGRPNVGKSSIMNSLLERERAIVTETPGTTRDTIEDILEINGLLFVITDTAGICTTGNPIEMESIKRTGQSLDLSDLIIFVVDGSEKIQDEDRFVISKLKNLKKQVIVTVNKIDLPQVFNSQDLADEFPDSPMLFISALENKGIEELIRTVEQIIFSEGIPRQDEVVLTRTRHRNLILKAENELLHAEKALSEDMSQEFIAIDLRGALETLGEIIGQTTTDDILNKIFSDFCIGK